MKRITAEGVWPVLYQCTDEELLYGKLQRDRPEIMFAKSLNFKKQLKEEPEKTLLICGTSAEPNGIVFFTEIQGKTYRQIRKEEKRALKEMRRRQDEWHKRRAQLHKNAGTKRKPRESQNIGGYFPWGL